MKGMPDAIAYCRVTREEQRAELEIQSKAIERFAAREGITQLVWFEEVGKGSDDAEVRRTLREALRLADKLKVPLLVNKLDRLSTSVHFISGLIARKRHVRFIVTDLGCDVDDFMMHTYAAFAELQARAGND